MACLAAAALLMHGGPASGDRPDRPDRAREADSLRRDALEWRSIGTWDARRKAMGQLERASLLAPHDYRIWLELGRMCCEAGERKRGRSCYGRARRLVPDDAKSHAAFGMAWTWEWLNSFEGPSLVRAEQEYRRACELDPTRAATWGALSALLLSRDQLAEAERAALRGLAADPEAWDPILALACVAWRRGEAARADSAFAAARSRVPEELRGRFVATAWVADDPRGPAGSGRIADPDLTTPENEAELDYLARLGLALLLFRDARGVRWDKRTELFVRYGAPGTVYINPPWSALATLQDRASMYVAPSYAPFYTDYRPAPVQYPYDVQVWGYPELGIWTELQDRLLDQKFELPPATWDYNDPLPDPRLLVSRPDLIALGDGRGVFRTMSPGSHPVLARGQVARFPTTEGTLLLAHVVTAGEPTDSVSGAWAVAAADGRVIASGARTMSSSACDPAEQRVAEFSVTVPPGEYRVDLSVSGPGGRRGLVRLGATVAPPVDGLDLSDVVLLCGPSEVGATDVVRIEPNLALRVEGDEPMAAYFEIDHLTPGSNGLSRFVYTYSLLRVEPDKKPKRDAPGAYQASREEEFAGTLRRQFITVPMRSIKRGTYELHVQVRDLVAGTRAAASLRFERE